MNCDITLTIEEEMPVSKSLESFRKLVQTDTVTLIINVQ